MRLAHAENNDEGTLKSFADSQIAADAQVVTDGLASYNSESLGERPHQAVVQTKQERRESDALQGCHWTMSLLKRWLLGTHAGAVRPKHLQAYLDEFAFRHNRRKTNGVGRIAARVIEQLVARPPLTMRKLIDETRAAAGSRQTQHAAGLSEAKSVERDKLEQVEVDIFRSHARVGAMNASSLATPALKAPPLSNTPGTT